MPGPPDLPHLRHPPRPLRENRGRLRSVTAGRTLTGILIDRSKVIIVDVGCWNLLPRGVLEYFNLGSGSCVKQVKLGGKNPATGGGKTPYCDITEGSMVDVDTNIDGVADLTDQSIFSVAGCLDDPSSGAQCMQVRPCKLVGYRDYLKTCPTGLTRPGSAC